METFRFYVIAHDLGRLPARDVECPDEGAASVYAATLAFDARRVEVWAGTRLVDEVLSGANSG